MAVNIIITTMIMNVVVRFLRHGSVGMKIATETPEATMMTEECHRPLCVITIVPATDK